MRTFRVMGMTMAKAKHMAYFDYLKEECPEEGFIEDRALRIFDEGKPKELAAYDDPNRAQEYVDMCRKMGDPIKNLTIEYQHPCGKNPSNGKLMFRWAKWNGSIPALTSAELGLI